MNRLGLRTKVFDKLATGQSFQSRLVLLGNKKDGNKKDNNLPNCIIEYKNISLAGVKIEYGNFAYKKPLRSLLSGKSQQWGANYVVYPVRVAIIQNSNSFAKLASVAEVMADELSNSTFTDNKTTLIEKFYCKNNCLVLGREVLGCGLLLLQLDLLFKLYESVWNVTDTNNKTYKNTVKSCTKNNRENTRWFSFISYNKLYRIAVYTWTRQLSWLKCCLKEEGKILKEGRSLHKGITTSIKKVLTVESDVLKLYKEGVSQNLLHSDFFLSSIHLQIKSAKYNWTLFELLAALQMFIAQLFSVQLFMAELANFYFVYKEQKMLSFRHCSEEIKRLRKCDGIKTTCSPVNLANCDKYRAIHINCQGLFMIA
ncbi:MAG: hypothetical protein KME64_10405 [Scytonematopsis contorta HA4267-MV1]|nr:hypothetical protein [Scytonematopsis contorta HA4267-MV1]